MTTVAFSSDEALIAALTAELVSAEDLAVPVHYWRDADQLWVRPVAPLEEATLSRLVELGARPSKKRAPRRARAGISWLEAVSTSFVGEPDDPAETVLIAVPEAGALLDLAGEMIRLGCDRQRYQMGDPPLLMVEAPPYYTLLRTLDPDSGLRAFVPSVRPRVWVELGHAHPLVDRIQAPQDMLVLVSRAGWRVLPEGPWEEIDRLVDVALPAGEVAFVPTALERRLTITLRLTKTGVLGQPALWVVRERPLEQIERMLHDLPTEVVDSLLFAVGALDGEDVVVLRAREGASPIELALRGERYAPHPQLPSLMLPCDAALEPPLSRSRLSRLLAHEARGTSWLCPGPGGSFTVEHASAEAFSPLSEYIDYVVSRGELAIAPWVRSAIFELDELERVDLVPAKQRTKRPRPEPRDGEEEPPVGSSSPRAVTKKAKAKKRAARPLAQPTLPGQEVESAAARHVAELEQRFLELEVAADASERLTLWLELAVGYVAAGRNDDAAHAFLRVLWERGDDAALARRWVAAEGLTMSLDELLLKDWPTPAEMRALVARLLADPVDVALEPLARFVDAHQDGLDLRARWLAHLAVSRQAGGDTLRLTRARDRALAELRGGLSLDRDVPSFIRARATGHGDLAMAEVLVAELERLWNAYTQTPRKRSAIEAPEEVTASYARRLFAYGFARLGRRERAIALTASQDAVDRSDPVHATLLGIYDERVRQATLGLSPTTPLTGELTAQLNQLGTFERYKVDRLREASSVLEPIERLDAIRGFQRGEADPRGDVFAALRALDAGRELSARVEEIVRQACRETTAVDERAQLLDGAMDFFFALPVSQATSLLEELVPKLEPVEPFYRAMLVEEALVLAAHFGHEELVDQLSERLATLIAELGPERAPEIGSVLERALRTLRRVGLRERAATLLETVARIAEGEAPELVVARVHAAGGFIYLGEASRAEPILAAARVAATSEAPKERLELTRAIAGAAALLPVEARVRELRLLASWLPEVTDSFSTNSHFCLSLLHFLESLITGLVPPDRGRDGPAAAYLDEDEHLVRRRIHRDLTEALS